MRLTAILFACANGVLAVNYAEWLQHNGLVSTYNRISKEHGSLIDMINDHADGITAFVPTNTAMSKWFAANPSPSYKTIDDTIKYMVTTKGAYRLSELEPLNGQKLPTLLSGESVEVRTTGAAPDLTIVIASGTNYKTNSSAGIANIDFLISNGRVQLVDTVFQLPKQIFNKDQQSKEVNAAPKASLGAGFLLSALSIGAMALL